MSGLGPDEGEGSLVVAIGEVKPKTRIRVGDEVWIATALLHRENPDREDFEVQEIVERVGKLDLSGRLRGGCAARLSSLRSESAAEAEPLSHALRHREEQAAALSGR